MVIFTSLHNIMIVYLFWRRLPQLGVFVSEGYLTEWRGVQCERIDVLAHENTGHKYRSGGKYNLVIKVTKSRVPHEGT